jgi:hypothetical protein
VLLAALFLTSCTGYITKHGNTFEGAGDHHFFVKKGNNEPERQAKYVRDDTEYFKQEDYISINLKSAYFNSFTEGILERSANSIASTYGKKSNVKGEIAIIINVGEKIDQIVNPADSTNPGRVVFYSKDIYEGQIINQSFGPVYGPIRWSGNPITIDITVIELDQEDNAQLGGILSSLAKIGTSSLSLTSSKVVDALNQVGAAFVYSNTDDVIAKYRFTLVPQHGKHDVALPVLREGDLIITRASERSTPLNWNNLCFNEGEGTLKIISNSNNQSNCNEINNNPPFNYIVLTIAKNIGENDQTPDLQLSQLNEAIRTSGSIQAIRDATSKISSAVSRDANFRKAKKSLESIESKKTISAVRTLDAAVVSEILQCSYIANTPLDLSSTIDSVKQICGHDYADSSITKNEFEYFVNKLVSMDNCLEPENVTSDYFLGTGDISNNSLNAARSLLRTKISKCQAKVDGDSAQNESIQELSAGQNANQVTQQ